MPQNLIDRLPENMAFLAPCGQTVIWTLKEPTLAELRKVTSELGADASQVQFVNGVDGLFNYLKFYFGF